MGFLEGVAIEFTGLGDLSRPPESRRRRSLACSRTWMLQIGILTSFFGFACLLHPHLNMEQGGKLILLQCLTCSFLTFQAFWPEHYA